MASLLVVKPMSPFIYRTYKVFFGLSLAVLAGAVVAGVWNSFSKYEWLPGPSYTLEEYIASLYATEGLESGSQQEKLKYLLDELNKRQAYIKLGDSLLENHAAYEMAAEQYRQALKLDENDILTHLKLGHALLLAGEREAARGEFLRADRLVDDRGAPRAASLHEDERSSLKTVEIFGEDREPALDTLIAAGNLYLEQLRDFTMAARLYDLAVRLEPTSPMLSARLALALAGEGNQEAADRWFLRSDSQPHKDAQTLLHLADFLNWRGDKQSAMERYRAVLELEPDEEIARAAQAALDQLNAEPAATAP